jgi:hypothetical protein
MESPLFPIVFWCNAREAGLIGAVSLFKFRHIEHLVVAAITELVVHRALPLMSRFENRVSPRGTEGSNPSPSSGESATNQSRGVWRNPGAFTPQRDVASVESFTRPMSDSSIASEKPPARRKYAPWPGAEQSQCARLRAGRERDCGASKSVMRTHPFVG